MSTGAPIYLPISERQAENLRKLALYLAALPADYSEFDMRTFRGVVKGEYVRTESDMPDEPMCGAVACAVGHGPNAGVDPAPGEDWFDYSERAFGAPDTEPVFLWCFASCWSLADNTAHGAAKRILWMLEHGVPPTPQIRSQQWRGAPLVYADVIVG